MIVPVVSEPLSLSVLALEESLEASGKVVVRLAMEVVVTVRNVLGPTEADTDVEIVLVEVDRVPVTSVEVISVKIED